MGTGRRFYEGELDDAANIDIGSLAAAAEVAARGLHALAVGDVVAASTLQVCTGSLPLKAILVSHRAALLHAQQWSMAAQQVVVKENFLRFSAGQMRYAAFFFPADRASRPIGDSPRGFRIGCCVMMHR